MLSPDSFARTHKRHVTDVVRVALERHGIIGFIETHATMTLLEARQLIWENVEHAPCDFQFVLDDGVPVSARQENTQRVLQFYPCIKIRACTPPAQSGLSSSSHASPLLAHDPVPLVSSSSISSTEKISVWTASGDEFAVWISDEYTFQQLRRDAARYWHVPASHVALVDRDGCLWPEQAKILAVMSVEELLQRKIVLESKGGAVVSSSSLASSSSLGGDKPVKSRSSSALARTLAVVPSRRRSSLEAALSPTRSISVSNGQDGLTSTLDETVNPVEELWRVFTFYCITGDSLDLECLRAHQFNKLLRDARVLGPAVTPAMADIIYTSETKGKPQASGKMNFDEFLNALVKVALARHRRASSKLLQRSTDTHEEDELVQRLVAECVLPRASRWPTHVWTQQTEQLRSHDIVAFTSKFLDPLLDIFAFYAKSHWLHAVTGVKEFHMAYADYQRFVNDFALANLQISSVDAAHAFVAACSSPPVHDALRGASQERTAWSPRRSSSSVEAASSIETDGGDDVLSCSSSSSLSSATALPTVASAFQKLAQSAEGTVLFVAPGAQVGRLCMSYSAFLDVLGRLGLVAFAKTRAGKLHALQSVKAVFHHMSRGLTRSRVLDIVAHHGAASVHAGRFYSGSVAFNNKFLDMWRYEGSPDYLAVGSGGTSGSSDGNDLASSHSGSAAGAMSPGTGTHVPASATPLSPSKRLTSSAALFDERVVPNGAGRGREALDRLVRNAFIRNAVAANATMSPVSPHAKDDCVTPATPTDDRGVAHASQSHNVGTDATRAIVPPPPAPQRLKSVGEAVCDQTNTHVADEGMPPQKTDTVVIGPNKPPVRTFVSGGVALHPDDERRLYESILLKGGVFKKYGQWGHPHRRFVWCSPAFDGVYWRPINKKHSLSKDGLAVAGLVAVLPGTSPRTRYAFMKHLSDEKSLSRCFSLVAEDRRLDLEADSEASRDLWMQALQYLVRGQLARPRIPPT